MPSHIAKRASKQSVRASTSCAACIRVGGICLIKPGQRTCDRCVIFKRPCRSSSSASPSIAKLRTCVSAIRAELDHILRILSTADAQDSIGVMDPPSGSSFPPLTAFLADLSFACVASEETSSSSLDNSVADVQDASTGAVDPSLVVQDSSANITKGTLTDDH